MECNKEMAYFIKKIEAYIPSNSPEKENKRLILKYIEQFPDSILLRDNEFAHITSSGFIMNPSLDKVLLVHHNIRKAWGWTGGHADGDGDLLQVAVREAKEETGVREFEPLSDEIASLDILPVFGHWKNGRYVGTHLHLSIAYILIAGEHETLVVKEDENSGVQWVGIDAFTAGAFDEQDVYLYNKLIRKAREISGEGLYESY